MATGGHLGEPAPLLSYRRKREEESSMTTDLTPQTEQEMTDARACTGCYTMLVCVSTRWRDYAD